MKKFVRILLLFILLTFIYMGVKVLAADSPSYIIKVTAPESGIYGVGQEITIKVEFNKPIKGQMPNYSIYFGNNTSEIIELQTANLTNFSSEVIYKYTIKSGDNGELKPNGFVNPSEYQIEDESGSRYFVSSPIMARFENKILADTTIQWTDFNNAQLSIDATDTNRNGFDIKVENVVLDENNMYYAHFSHQAQEDITFKDSDDIHNNVGNNGTKIWQESLNNLSSIIYCGSDIHNLFAEAGDIYVTICEIDNDTDIPKIVLPSTKINRLNYLPITQRITAFFFKDKTATFCWEIYGENDRKVNYKIGKVNDLELLKSLKNGDETAYDNLMNYAKKTETSYTGTLKLGDDKAITDKLGLIDNEYYFVYLELDTENGKYYPIEDVSLYQAIVDENSNVNTLASIIDKEFKWNLDGKDTTLAKDLLPDTGFRLIMLTILITLVIISIVVFKKYKSYKDIK